MSYCFLKAVRLRARWEFQRLSKSSQKLYGHFLTIEIRPNGSSVTKLGITATKRFGNSPQRNRFKRLVREAFRLSYLQLLSGQDFNIRPTPAAKEAKMQDIQEELIKLAKSKDA